MGTVVIYRLLRGNTTVRVNLVMWPVVVEIFVLLDVKKSDQLMFLSSGQTACGAETCFRILV